jgi:RHS repeat-associated protein
MSGLFKLVHIRADAVFRRGRRSSRRPVAMAVTLAVAAQFALAGPAIAASHDGSLVGFTQTPSVPVTPVTSHYQKPTPESSFQAPKPAWPEGTASVTLAGTKGAQAAGSLPVTLTAVASGAAGLTSSGADPEKPSAGNPAEGSEPSKAAVTVEPQSASGALGINGVVLSVGRADGAATAGNVQISLSYAAFKNAFGGDYGTRLALVALPACALTTPKIAACRTETPVTFTNNSQAQALSATIVLPGMAASPTTGSADSSRSASSVAVPSRAAAPALVLAAMTTSPSSSGSGGGSYSATTLKPSDSWSAGGGTDGFTQTYPITVPDVPGGLEPQLGLSYNSQSLDGLTSNTNNQAGDVGDGWDLTASYIERSYASCHQNPSGPTQTYDNCWSSNNQLTLDLNGQATTLIKDDSTGTYQAQNDSNERIQYETGAVNGAQNGEYWVVTTSDGTQYYFGENELPGYASGDATTNSVDTEPIYAATSGQPCYNATFSSSHCEQAYRWNLDYVVDTHSDIASYWYNTTTGYYAMDNGTTAPAASAYTRDSYLAKIEYGQRAGQVYTTTPAAQVSFTANGRCSSSPTGCAVSTLPSNASNFPDVPYDLNCASGASCTSQSPSFWSEEETTGIQTQALVGSALTNVDSWALDYALPAVPKGDTSTPSLWLSSITHTGQDTSAEPSGGAAISLPSMVFTGTMMENRVNLTNGYPWITRQRLTQITTETDEVITVNYSAPACGSATPSSDAQNTMLCYPVYWYPTNTTSPTKDYFNKYIVNSVTEQDKTGGSGNDAIVTSYTPVGNPAWHHDDDPLTPANQDTWDQFRGYPGMIVSTGTSPDPITKTQYTYFQGMNGDFLTPTTTRTSSVTDAFNRDPAVTNLDQYAGQTYETQVFNGASLITDTIDTPWTSSATATHALSGGLPSQQAFLIGDTQEQVYTPLASGATRETETQNTHDSYGRVTQVNDLGDVTVPSQNLCTSTTYDDNTTAWILDKPSEVKTVSVNCSTTPVYPADAVSDEVTMYDQAASATTPPTVGDVTETEQALSYPGGAPSYAVMSQATVDEYGRTLTSTDADGRVTKTAYTPATGADPTTVTVTDPLNMATITNYDPVRGVSTQTTTPAGYVTVQQYDALGRMTAVFKPGFGTAGPANLKYTYSISNSGPSVVDTYTLNNDETYRISETIYDSMLRAREVQAQTVDGGRDITDTYYNTDGWQSEATNPYYDAGAVSTTLVQAQPGIVPGATGYTYDGDGRKTAQIAYADGTQTWQTSYSYGGNFTTTVPPAGGTAQTTVTDARGRQTDLIQYLAGDPTNYATDPTADYTDTKYTYDSNGDQATETDAASNSWSWTYNLLGNQLTATDPDTGTSTNTYDNAGQLLTSTDNRGKQSTYVYDKDGRKTAAYDTTSTQTLSSGNEVASWVYDTLKKGYLTSSASYSNGDVYTTATTGYTTLGEPQGTKATLTGTDAALVPAAGYTIKFGYNFVGDLNSQQDPTMGGLPAEVISYGFDEFDQPTSLASTGGATWTYASAVGYSEYGQALQYTMPTVGGSVQATVTYDPQTQALDTVKTTDTTSTNPVDSLTYTYGNSLLPTNPNAVSPGSGLVTQTTDSQNGGSTVDTQCFTYDYAQRLSQAWTATDQCAAIPSSGNSSTVGGTDSPYWQSWTYDAAGDRLSEIDHDTTGNTADDTTTAYHYPAAGSSTDQPTTLTSTSATGPNAAAETASYQYDASGNQTSVTGGAMGNQTYTWNDQGQLQSAVSSTGTTNYVYDADGSQIIMRDPASTTFTAGDVQLTLTGSTLTGVRYYSIGGTTIAERTSAGVVCDLIPDRQGTDQLAVNTAATQTVTRRQYLPFGGTRGTVAPWVGGDKGYIGGLTDLTTALITLGARDYDSVDGRFISADPLFESADPTQMGGYDYSGNDPVTDSDPSGRMLMLMYGGGARTSPPPPPPPPASSTIMTRDLPVNKGPYPYVPPKSSHGVPQRSRGGGFVDQYGNVWKPDLTKKGWTEWDVQHPNGSHTNVDDEGTITHGADNFPAKPKARGAAKPADPAPPAADDGSGTMQSIMTGAKWVAGGILVAAVVTVVVVSLPVDAVVAVGAALFTGISAAFSW